MIEVKSLRRSFGEFALRIDDFRVERGRYAVVLGPSGSGKSLFLKTLAGLFLPDGGTIEVGGKDVTGLPPERRPVGLVFQEPSLFPHYNVFKNIAYGLRGPDKQKIVEELAEVLRIKDLLHRPVQRLSGGEAQKVALARALAVKPDVLLLDEPLSQVDHNSRLELQSELKRVHREMDLTSLHVTHNREETLALAEDCAVMLGGRIIQHCDTEQMQKQPECEFVRRFLGLEGEAVKAPGCEEKCLAGTGLCDREDREAREDQADGG
jgi:ABC-type Fe3+/spermidine/putrescine transport system ATPase subunit